MGNCLVTKLKESVNNDNLLKLGNYKMHFNYKNATTSKFLIKEGVCTMTILGNNNYYFIYNGQSLKTVPCDNNTFITFPAGEYDVLFDNKYVLIGSENALQLDINIFKFCNNINYIGCSDEAYGDISFLNGKSITTGIGFEGRNNKGVYGSLSALRECKNVMLYLKYTSISGDIALLGHSGDKSIKVNGSLNITGSLEGLVAALASDPDHPFTSGTKNINIYGSNVTINGSKNNVADANLYLVMTDADHWYYPSNNNDLIDNSNYHLTIYAKNPTAEQISAWEANNNTVVELS